MTRRMRTKVLDVLPEQAPVVTNGIDAQREHVRIIVPHRMGDAQIAAALRAALRHLEAPRDRVLSTIEAAKRAQLSLRSTIDAARAALEDRDSDDELMGPSTGGHR